MIDVKTKKCIHENCNKIPLFNFPGKNTRLYCEIHKTDEMINIAKKMFKRKIQQMMILSLRVSPYY